MKKEPIRVFIRYFSDPKSASQVAALTRRFIVTGAVICFPLPLNEMEEGEYWNAFVQQFEPTSFTLMVWSNVLSDSLFANKKAASIVAEDKRRISIFFSDAERDRIPDLFRRGPWFNVGTEDGYTLLLEHMG